MVTPVTVGSVMLTVGEYQVSLIPFIILLFVGVFLLVPFTLFNKWYFYRRRLKKNVITADYESPAGLLPAEMQYLFGGINQERVVAATIIDLIQRSYLHMRKVNGKKRLFAGPKESATLTKYEKMLLVRVDKEGGAESEELMRNPIAFIDGDPTVVDPDATNLSGYIHDSLRQRGLVGGKGVNRFFISVFQTVAVLLFGLVWWPVMLFGSLSLLEAGSSDLSSMVSFPEVAIVATVILCIPLCIVSIVVVKFRAKLLGRRWMSTNKLSKLWPQIIGFRQYVKLAEQNKLNFNSTTQQTQISKDVLPHAVALGFVKKWRDIVS
jgi:hypothetical protein